MNRFIPTGRVWRTDLGFTLLGVTALALSLGADLVVFTIARALWMDDRAIVGVDRVAMVVRSTDERSPVGLEAHFGPRVVDCLRSEHGFFDVVAGQAAIDLRDRLP